MMDGIPVLGGKGKEEGWVHCSGWSRKGKGGYAGQGRGKEGEKIERVREGGRVPLSWFGVPPLPSDTCENFILNASGCHCNGNISKS